MPRKEFDRLIVWLRRDLRLEDNAALFEACAAADEIIPLFVLDEEILKRADTGVARVIFLLDALRVLDNNLNDRGGRLIIRHGKTPDEVVKACYEFNAQGVYFHQEYEPYGRRRDDLAVSELNKAGKVARSFPGVAFNEPSSILSQFGTPYTVFTPYKRMWLQIPQPQPVPAPAKVNVPAGVVGRPIPTPAELGLSTDQVFECGGEDAARGLLNDFVENGLKDYQSQRDYLSRSGTSRLSHHLHLGTISARAVVSSIRNKIGAEAYLTEIAWRDFYLQILFHFPHVEKGAFKRHFDQVRWETNETYFQAWCNGLTGYPVVDAAMRQLNQEAWMHNRARMIVASFLTKDLLINWQLGEKYFMQKLVDGDLASNNGGWQWSAGTGTDAQPYFRVFNPTAQGQKFDPTGEYVRRYVTELKDVPDAVVHTPWLMTQLEQMSSGCILGEDYPLPIVEHNTQRLRAIELYRSIGDRN